MASKSNIGLALSGGGARAMAFHLGCLRALSDKGILERVHVISSVSGGSVIAALYAYSDDSFEEFEQRVTDRLKKGFVKNIILATFFSSETPKILWSLFVYLVHFMFKALFGLIYIAFYLVGLGQYFSGVFDQIFINPPVRYASRTTAFAKYLNNYVYSKLLLSDVKRKNLNIVINATELRTGTAFRYGNKQSGAWRFGRLIGQTKVGSAVAASAAFPSLLPAIDGFNTFKSKSGNFSERTIIADGGIYDNLGISCLLPNRNAEFSTNTFNVDFIICCAAGQGLPDARYIPFNWVSRMLATVDTIHRRTHSMSFDLLHRLSENNEIKGFVLPYLGQQDSRLPCPPTDLVTREDVMSYPTDFSPMSDEDIKKISMRGEQLTRHLIEIYYPNL